MSPFCCTLIRSTKSPDLRSGGLFSPASVRSSVFTISNDLYIVFDVVAKNSVTIDCHAVCSGYDHGDLDITSCRIDLSPVLVHLGVENVILIVDTVLCEDSNGSLDTLREIDMCAPRCSAFRGNVVRYVLCNAVVEGGIPCW